jgi:hypothetical protein
VIIKYHAIKTYGEWRFQAVPEIIKYNAIDIWGMEISSCP